MTCPSSSLFHLAINLLRDAQMSEYLEHSNARRVRHHRRLIRRSRKRSSWSPWSLISPSKRIELRSTTPTINSSPKKTSLANRHASIYIKKKRKKERRRRRKQGRRGSMIDRGSSNRYYEEVRDYTRSGQVDGYVSTCDEKTTPAASCW